jgi:hypothetical protein
LKKKLLAPLCRLDPMFIWSLCWCFALVFLAEVLQLSLEIGAFLAGLSLADSATALDLPRRTADRYWAYARAWIYKTLNGEEQSDPGVS